MINVQDKFHDNFVSQELSLEESIKVLEKAYLKILFVLSNQQKLIGTITDGDIRRGILNGIPLSGKTNDFMQKDFVTSNDFDSIDEIHEKIAKNDLIAVPDLDKQGIILTLYTNKKFVETPQKMNNPILLMAGGMGSRLAPLTNEIPKPLLKVGNKPIIETIMENFIKSGFSNLFISTFYKRDKIKNFIGNGDKWEIEVSYVEESEPLGTAGCLSLLPNTIEDPLIVMNGDVLTKINIKSLLDYHASMEAAITMCSRDFSYQVPYGVITSNDGLFEKITEKPINSSQVSAGIYVINPGVLKNIEKNKFLDMPTLINDSAKNNLKVAVFPIHEYWLDIGQKRDFERAQIDFKRFFDK